MGYRWTGSTRFRIKNVIANYQSTGLETMFYNPLQRALMTDQSEPFAMWGTGASHFLLPLDQLPNGATETLKAVVKLAVGNAPALFWEGGVQDTMGTSKQGSASPGPGVS
eukprot:8095240-Prorocentrum_lima.AAC.1